MQKEWETTIFRTPEGPSKFSAMLDKKIFRRQFLGKNVTILKTAKALPSNI